MIYAGKVQSISGNPCARKKRTIPSCCSGVELAKPVFPAGQPHRNLQNPAQSTDDALQGTDLHIVLLLDLGDGRLPNAQPCGQLLLSLLPMNRVLLFFPPVILPDLGIGIGLCIYGPQLAFFWGIFGKAAIALWLVASVWIAGFLLISALCLRLLPRIWAILAMPFAWTGLEYFRRGSERGRS